MTTEQINSSTATRTIARWRVGKGYAQTSSSLAVYRIIFAATFLFVLGPGRYGPGGTSGEVGGVPAGMFHPPLGPGMLLRAAPPAGVILAVELILTAAMFAIFIGAFTRTASLTAAACGLVLTTLLYSEGKIDHAILWTVVVPAVMAFTSWGDTWSVDAGRVRVQARKGFRSDATRPVAIVALVLGIVFGTAAALKAATGWLDPDTSSTLGWVFAQAVQEGREAGPPLFFTSTPSFVWLVVDYATVLFEAGFLIAALRRHWLVPYLCVAAAFHFGATFTGFPPFLEIIVVYLLFVRLDAVAARLRRPLDGFGHAAGQRPVLVCGVTAIAFALYCAAAVALDGPLTVARLLVATGTAPIVVLLWPTLIAIGVVVLLKRSAPPQDRAGNRLPAWAFLVAVTVVAAQTTATLLVSEPYPALTGPRFMGTFDDGRTVNIAEQHFWIINGGRRTEVDHAAVLDMSQAGSVELGETRFPSPDLDIGGRVTTHPSLQDRLRNQYHHFSSAHLSHYGGPLTDTERSWIRTNLAKHGVACDRGCTLEVEWQRLSFDRRTGKLLATETVDRHDYPLN